MSTMQAKAYQFTDHDIVLSDYDTPYVLRVRDLPIEQKPREKLALLGPSSLRVAELVAILLGVGTKKEEVLVMAERILKEYGEKAIIHETDPRKLSTTLDIPFAKACQIIASFELGRRYFTSHAGRAAYIRNAQAAYQYFKNMGSLQKEQLRGLYLNSRYQVVHDEVISVGSLTANIVHPREVFRPAIEHGAVAIILAHNHPSNSLKPSQADQDVTEQLVAAGQLLGIELLDHLIITSRGFKNIRGEVL